MSDLRTRILNAAPVTVEEIVSLEVAQKLEEPIRAGFLSMRVRWADNRSWGRSFKLGDQEVVLGHRRGDHVASRPWVHGLSPDEAGEFLRVQVEGTALHELGHAVLDAYQAIVGEREFGAFLHGLKESVLVEGPTSSYFGHDPNVSWNDALHEVYAEALRYALTDETLERASPLMNSAALLPLRVVTAVLQQAP